MRSRRLAGVVVRPLNFTVSRPLHLTTLYRPVGPEELQLIRASNWREFPPRLPEQPIFYPVANREYAAQIARDWNVKAHGAGYVTQFAVRALYLQQFPLQKVGGSVHLEYWVPAERLAEFNANIVGLIEVVDTFPSPLSEYAGS